jgi:amino acid adenylation domain-containing protein
MLYHYLRDPGNDIYVEQLSLGITGKINRRYFEQAWDIVISTNEMLRTRFRWEKLKRPVQMILKKYKIHWKYYDLSILPANNREKKQRLEEIKAKDRKQAAHLQEVPFRITLAKVGESKYEMIISNHHILFDGWSTGIILKEFFNAYNDLFNKNIPDKPAKPKFKEFIQWHQTRDKKEEEKRFWKEYLRGFDAPTALAIKRRKSGNRYQQTIENYGTGIDRETRDNLEAHVKKYKLTLAALLYTGWGILLQKYNNCHDVIFGTTVSGRGAKIKGIQDMVGLFINTIPMRVITYPHKKIIEILYHVNKTLQTRKAYEYTSLVDIKKCSELDNKEELFDSIMVIENYPLTSLKTDSLDIHSFSIFESTNYDLAIAVITSADNIEINFVYNKELFSQGSIGRLSDHFKKVILDIIDNPGKEISAIEMVSREERKEILYKYNKREAEYPVDKTIQQLFAEQVRETPHRIALVGTRQKEGESMLVTYGELNKKAGQLACLLREKGIHPGSLAAIMVDRSLEMIIGILGILKAGAAYVPLNPKAPLARSKYILAECSVNILLTTGRLYKQGEEGEPDIKELNSWGVEKIFLDEGKGLKSYAAAAFNEQVLPGALAYIIFTSGSTGKPKGVAITHANLCPLLHWGYHHLGLRANNSTAVIHRVLQNLSYYFDWSVWEIFITLTSGSSLYITPGEVLQYPEACTAFILRKGITVIHMTPTQYQAIANAAIGMEQRLGTIKYLCIGAEKLTHDLVVRSYALVNDDCRIFNMYGPTEAAIMAAVLEIQRANDEKYRELSSIPIGIPIANSYLLVLDRDLNMCPVQVTGELYIAGDGLARGYLNDPERSCKSFVKNIFPGIRGHRLYKTGDTVRWLPDGSIEFLGRMDNQVKIRGYRIEIGEIECQMLKHPGVKEAVVLTRERASGDKYLCAYFAANSPDAPELKKYLSHMLPDYMIPSFFIKMKQMPLNPNGKLDKRALPDPGSDGMQKKYLPPGDEVERKLTGIWSEVLGIEKSIIGIDDDFFERGGHSLKATLLISKVQKAFDVKIPLVRVYENPELREMACYIKEAAPERYRNIPLVEKKEFYPLSFNQRRIWFIYQQWPESAAYNIPDSLTLEFTVDAIFLKQALREVVQRHESLRTAFKIINDEPVQLIVPTAEIPVEMVDISALSRRKKLLI